MKVTINIDKRRAYPLGARFHRLAVELKQARQAFHRNQAAGLHRVDSESACQRAHAQEQYHRDLAACCEPYGILLSLADLLGTKAAKSIPELRDVLYTTETGRKLDVVTCLHKPLR